MSSLATLSRFRGVVVVNGPLSRPYSGAGEEYYRMQKIHEGLKDVEALYAKYRMDLFTEHRQVDEMVKKGLLNDTFAANLKHEIDSRNEAVSTTIFLPKHRNFINRSG